MFKKVLSYRGEVKLLHSIVKYINLTKQYIIKITTKDPHVSVVQVRVKEPVRDRTVCLVLDTPRTAHCTC